jgi:hypothetical protein
MFGISVLYIVIYIYIYIYNFLHPNDDLLEIFGLSFLYLSIDINYTYIIFVPK